MMSISPTYANEKTFALYQNYLAIKKHFSSDKFDYHKYRGKTNAKYEHFRTRKDVYYFHKLSKAEDTEGLLLANMIVDPNSWIGDIVEESGNYNYIKWKQRMDSLTHTFKSDLNKLDDNYQSNFAINNGQHPHIMTLYLQKQISLETFTLLTHFAKIFDYWQQNLVDRIISYDIIKLSKKYRPFLDISEKKFKDLIRERFF